MKLWVILRKNPFRLENLRLEIQFMDLKLFLTAENHKMMKYFVKKREISALVFTGFHWNQNKSKNFITPSARSPAESSFRGIFSILIMNHHEYSRTQIDTNHSAVSDRHSLHLIKHWNDHEIREWSCARYPTEPIHQLRFSSWNLKKIHSLSSNG